MPSTDNAWHLSKSVPISLIFAIFMQSVAAVWWASSIENRVSEVSKSDDLQTAKIQTVEGVVQGMQVNSATLTAQLTSLKEGLDELKQNQHETIDLLRQLTTSTGTAK